MANSINKNFRATSGFDAANQKIINVATADRNVLTDGVNVDYFIKENTIQQYDPNRSYPDRPAYYAGFAVIYSNRIWTAKRDIPSPAGPFFDGYWQPLREDPKWVSVNEGTRQVLSGDYITVNTQEGKPVTLTLPPTPADGDTVTIKDVGGRPGFIDVLIKAPVQSILDRGKQVQQVLLTIPFAELVFVYNNSLWNLFTNIQADLGKEIASSAAGYTEVQAGEHLVRVYDSAKAITVKLPKNANDGDMIHFIGMDPTAPALYHLIVNTFDNTTSVGTPGTTTYESREAINGYFVYDATLKLWTLFDSDARTRLRVISTDTTLLPNDAVLVTGTATNNTTASTVNLTLPTNIAPGDTVSINLTYLRLKQTVNIRPATGDLILATNQFLQYPKSSEYPSTLNPWNTVNIITYNGETSYLPNLTLSYYEEGTGATLKKYWIVKDNNIITERVDPSTATTRARVGVIALANQTQANLEYENISTTVNPLAREVAITPETLANRVALTNRRGIARLATVAEVNGLASDGAWLADVIVSPQTLDKKQATETMRGLAEIATQAEANTMGTSADDSRIITAKKLDARRATTTQSGIVLTVANGGVAPVAGPTVTRDTAGTLIYNFSDKANVVTPSTLREYIATELALGSVYLATDAEVRGGTAAADAKHPIVVTPSALEKKTATDALIGFTQVATQTEVNTGTDYFKYVTPKTLNDRVATGAMTGIAKLATQVEFDNGDPNYISDPIKIKTFFSRAARTSVTTAAGLTQTGNLWDGITFNIVAPTTTQRGTTRLATQAEVTTGTDNTTIVTPLTLHGKKATVSAEGIIQLATQAEVVAGTVTTKAVVPADLIHVIQTNLAWEATPARRGTVKTSLDSSTWQGDRVNGNANINIETQFNKNGIAVSPYEFNRVLRNYLPIQAKAVDSELLDGLDSLQFVRRDIDQTVNGAITFAKPITAKDVSNLEGLVRVGVYDNVVGEVTPKIRIASSVNAGGSWVFGTAGASASLPSFHFGYKYTTDVSPAIDIQAFEISYTGATKFNNQVTIVGATSITSSLNTTGVISTDSVGFRIAGQDAITAASGITKVGTLSRGLDLIASDAGAIRALDAGTVYQVMTTKNRATILDPLYTKKSGDTVTGRLNVTQPITFTLPEANIGAGITAPSANNFGSWVCNITNATLIAGLPGYLVGILDTNNETGQPTGYYREYQEFKGHGTLSQFGSSESSGAGTYQIWAPRPTVTTANHMASTYYLRHWNPVAAKWDGWSRLYTSSNPPLHTEIGAISNNDTTFDSLKIRTWFQIDHVKMWADPVSKSVKFEWVD